MKNKLYITNVPFQLTEDELTEMFSKYGKVVEVSIPTEQNTNRTRGFAFVTFETEEAAQRAQDGMNEYECHGRQLCIRPAEEKTGRGGRWK